MSERLNPQHLHEMHARMNVMPMKTAEQHRFTEVGTLEIRDNPKSKALPEVFSAQLANRIMDNERLRFEIVCIQNLLEQGYPDLALERCRAALK